MCSQCAVEGSRPPGRERDQPASLVGSPLLECAHQGPPGTAAPVLAADEDLLDPAHRAVRVEGEVPETQEVAQVIIRIGRQEQQGVIGSEQGRVAEVEPGPGERERLRQPGGQIRDGAGVAVGDVVNVVLELIRYRASLTVP